jgi:hypothetical protein
VNEDQVKRKWAYEAAHPGVNIAAGRDEAGRIIFTASAPGRNLTAPQLGELLDQLEEENP